MGLLNLFKREPSPISGSYVVYDVAASVGQSLEQYAPISEKGKLKLRIVNVAFGMLMMRTLAPPDLDRTLKITTSTCAYWKQDAKLISFLCPAGFESLDDYYYYSLERLKEDLLNAMFEETEAGHCYHMIYHNEFNPSDYLVGDLGYPAEFDSYFKKHLAEVKELLSIKCHKKIIL